MQVSVKDIFRYTSIREVLILCEKTLTREYSPKKKTSRLYKRQQQLRASPKVKEAKKKLEKNLI